MRLRSPNDAVAHSVHEGQRLNVPAALLPAEVDVLVIGGGITGCSTAYFLAEAGAEISVVERYDLNTEASGRNAGSLHGQIQHQPFLERGEQWAREFIPALEFLVEAVTMWTTLGERIGHDLEVTTNGGLLVAETEGQLRDIERKVQIENAAGIDSSVIDAAELRRIAPYVSESMVGAELATCEGVANPLLAAPAVAEAATALGAKFHTGVDVRQIDSEISGFRVITSQGAIRCRRLVIASGSGLRGHSASLGLSLPIEEAAIQLSATEPVERMVEHLVYFAGGALTFKQAKAGSLLIGGGWPAQRHPESGNVTVSVESLRSNLEVAQRIAPMIGKVKLLRSWTGVVRETPDLLPIIGTVPGATDAVVGLFPHMGLTAGPLLGNTLAKLAAGDDPGVDIDSFNADRF